MNFSVIILICIGEGRNVSSAKNKYVDATISRKSGYKCHSRFKDSYIKLSSYLRVACATEENRNSFPRTKLSPPSLSRSREKYACHSIIVEPSPDTIKHDVASCSRVAMAPCLSPSFFLPLSSFTPSSALHPLSRL